jgi:hypothetical protein
MDVHSSKAEAPGLFNEKASEITNANGTSNMDPTHLTIDTHASNLRSTSNSPAAATHTPNTQTAEELARFQNADLRTLPGTIMNTDF